MSDPDKLRAWAEPIINVHKPVDDDGDFYCDYCGYGYDWPCPAVQGARMAEAVLKYRDGTVFGTADGAVSAMVAALEER